MDSLERFLDLQRKLLEAQLEIISKYQKSSSPEERTSKIDVIEQILKNAGRPLHISEIITTAKKDFDVDVERDSAVSAIIKRMKTNQGFIKTGPNTFAWKPSHD